MTEGIFYYIRKDMAPIATVEHSGLKTSLKPLTEDALWHREERCSPICSAQQSSVLLTFLHMEMSFSTLSMAHGNCRHEIQNLIKLRLICILKIHCPENTFNYSKESKIKY